MPISRPTIMAVGKGRNTDMHRDTTIRILMAFMLATCSPMWCQCMIRAASAVTTPSALAVTASCDTDDTCDRVCTIPVAVLCCQETCDDSGTANDGSCDCECCAQKLVASPSSGQSNNAAALAIMHAPVPGLNAAIAADAEGDMARWIGRYRTGPPPPPLLTLVSQHSLMLI